MYEIPFPIIYRKPPLQSWQFREPPFSTLTVSSHTDLRITVDRKEYFLPIFTNRYILTYLFLYLKYLQTDINVSLHSYINQLNFGISSLQKLYNQIVLNYLLTDTNFSHRLYINPLNFLKNYPPEITSSDRIELFTNI